MIVQGVVDLLFDLRLGILRTDVYIDCIRSTITILDDNLFHAQNALEVRFVNTSFGILLPVKNIGRIAIVRFARESNAVLFKSSVNLFNDILVNIGHVNFHIDVLFRIILVLHINRILLDRCIKDRFVLTRCRILFPAVKGISRILVFILGRERNGRHMTRKSIINLFVNQGIRIIVTHNHMERIAGIIVCNNNFRRCNRQGTIGHVKSHVEVIVLVREHCTRETHSVSTALGLLNHRFATEDDVAR